MPKVVDHAARREQVAASAVRLVATEGIDALTARSVAASAGFSTAVVSHYFAGMDDLLLATFTYASDRARARFLAAPGFASALESLLAIGDEAREEWTVFLAFWGKAIALPELAHEQAHRVRSASARLARMLDADPELTLTHAAAAAAARQLLIAVQGISTYAVFDPDEWSAERQRRMLRQQIAWVLG